MDLAKLGFMLIFLGFLIFFVAILVPLLASIRGEGVTEVSGCIVMFFIPICFGYGSPQIAPSLIIAAIALTIVTLITGLIIFRESRKIMKNAGIT